MYKWIISITSGILAKVSSDTQCTSNYCGISLQSPLYCTSAWCGQKINLPAKPWWLSRIEHRWKITWIYFSSSQATRRPLTPLIHQNFTIPLIKCLHILEMLVVMLFSTPCTLNAHFCIVISLYTLNIEYSISVFCLATHEHSCRPSKRSRQFRLWSVSGSWGQCRSVLQAV